MRLLADGDPGDSDKRFGAGRPAVSNETLRPAPGWPPAGVGPGARTSGSATGPGKGQVLAGKTRQSRATDPRGVLCTAVRVRFKLAVWRAGIQSLGGPAAARRDGGPTRMTGRLAAIA